MLVSIGYENNGVGAIQPMAEIAELIKGSGIALHTDAVTAEGLVPIDNSLTICLY